MSGSDPAVAELPRASVRETLAVGVQVALPLLARGIILRRPRMLALLQRLDADRRAARVLGALRDRHQGGPVRLRVPGRSFAVVLRPQDARTLLLAAPEPYAPVTQEKAAALRHFQPHGVLISSAPDRAERRAFTEQVLEPAHEVHSAGEAVTAAVREEAQRLAGRAVGDGRLTWDAYQAGFERAVRRAVLGHSAGGDETVHEQLHALRRRANWAYLVPQQTRLRRQFLDRVGQHLLRAEPGSLAAAIAANRPSPDVHPRDQVAHWLFAFDAAAIASYRALALLAASGEHLRDVLDEISARDLTEPQDLPLLRAAVQESLRLWPTTLAILRESTTPTRWEGRLAPAGTSYAIVSAFLSRDPQLVDFADRFEPQAWLDGRAWDSWAVLPFSAGPAVCPGRNLVLLVTSTWLAALLPPLDLALEEPPPWRPGEPLPHTFAQADVSFAAKPATSRASIRL